MMFDDDPRLDEIVRRVEGLKVLQAKLKAMPSLERGEVMLQQAQGYLELRTVILSAGPSWAPDPKRKRRPRKPPLRPGSIAHRMLEFFKGRTGTIFRTADLVREFSNPSGGPPSPRTLRGRIAELLHRSLIEKIGRGEYRYRAPA